MTKAQFVLLLQVAIISAFCGSIMGVYTQSEMIEHYTQKRIEPDPSCTIIKPR